MIEEKSEAEAGAVANSCLLESPGIYDAFV